jgi:hypothetical protein
MRTKALSGILLWLALSLLLPSASPAAVVGRLTQVEGEVDLLKKGQLPAIPLKPNDGVETGDVVRTKSLSKAQITFVDDTVLTIAPGTRIAIDKYMVDGGKRNAVLHMFQGVALAVVSKIFKANEPDFMVKTNTAIMGVRGTKVGLRLYPNFSEILTFQGHTEVKNRFPEIPGVVQLKDGQGTRVTRGLPPTKQFKVSEQEFKQFMHQLDTGLNARVRDQDSTPSSSGSNNYLAQGASVQGVFGSTPQNIKPGEQISIPGPTTPEATAPVHTVENVIEPLPATQAPTPPRPLVITPTSTPPEVITPTEPTTPISVITPTPTPTPTPVITPMTNPTPVTAPTAPATPAPIIIPAAPPAPTPAPTPAAVGPPNGPPSSVVYHGQGIIHGNPQGPGTASGATGPPYGNAYGHSK